MVFKLLNEHLKIGIPIHPAGEWILDNFYIIEKTVKTIVKELPLKKYTNFIGLENGANKGFARVFVLAQEIVSYTDAKIDDEILKDLLKAYQSKKNLNMDEIWNIGIFLQIALIENIREVCEKIYSSQIQKYKVENIIERLIENKDEEKLKFKNIPLYKTRSLGYGEMKYPFIEHMSYRLRSYGRGAYKFTNVLENEVNMMGTTISDIIKKEHFDIALKKVSVGNSIVSINKLSRINFLQIFEEINGVEEILKKDPANVYSKMDYKTKICYRNKIKEISKKTKISEIYIAQKCVELAKKSCKDFSKIANDINNNEFENNNSSEIENNNNSELENNNNNEIKNNDDSEKNVNIKNTYEISKSSNVKQIITKESHIGYYLVDEGKKELLESISSTKIYQLKEETKVKIYISFIWSITIFVCFLLTGLIHLDTGTFQNTILNTTLNIVCKTFIFIFLLIPIQTIVMQTIQFLASKFVKPKMIPKLDISGNIPEEFATMVIIPTIIKSEEKIDELSKKMEVYYMANKSNNIYFTILADPTSSAKEVEEFDKDIINYGKGVIEKLNAKYPDEKFPKFNFIYRKRMWNDKEECFLGYERKRGYIKDFNEYMQNNQKFDWFLNTIEENIEKTKKDKPKIKYVITLDSDTDLVLNSAFELIGAMAHILNKPILNKNKDLVVEGFGIIAPRVGVDLEISNKNLFTKIFAGLRTEQIRIQMLFRIFIWIILKREFLQEKEFTIWKFFLQF